MLVVALVLGAAHPVQAEPRRARELLDQARALRDEGRTELALAKLEQSIDQNVDLRDAYREAIPLWVASGQLGRLRLRLERVTARHQDFADAWYALGYAYRKQQRADLAVLAYQSYISLRPGEAAAQFGLGMAYKTLGDSARAERAFLVYILRELDPLRTDFVDQARREILRLVWQRYRASWMSSHSGQ